MCRRLRCGLQKAVRSGKNAVKARSCAGCYARRPGGQVELRILGPFEVCDDSGQPVKLPAGRERALLAVLALRRGEVVSTDALVDALWGETAAPDGREGPAGLRLTSASNPRVRRGERRARDAVAGVRPSPRRRRRRCAPGSRRSRRMDGASWTTTRRAPSRPSRRRWRSGAGRRSASSRSPSSRSGRSIASTSFASRRSRDASRGSCGWAGTARWWPSSRPAWTSTRSASGCGAS